MVRTLDSALTTALNSVTRRPALTLTIEDHVIHYAAYQNPGTGDALHDACIASDKSIVRCYVSRNSFTFDLLCATHHRSDGCVTMDNMDSVIWLDQ